MPNYQHPYSHPQYAQQVYTQPVYTPDFHAGQVSPSQVPFPAYNGQLATPHPRPKHVSRHTNTTNERFLSKSALKNGHMVTPHRPENGIPVTAPPQVPRRRSTRGREDSRGRNSEQTLTAGQQRNSSNSSRRGDRSISRQRTNSKTRFIPDHLFLSFKNDNEIHVSNLFETESDRLSEAVVQMWPEGHDVMQRKGYKWSVRFHGSPWTASPTEFAGITARRIIRNLFITLAVLGFTYTTSTNSKRFPLRSLVFSRVPPDVHALQSTDFFILSISSNRRKFTFLDPPDSIDRNLAVDINPYFPYQVASVKQPGKGLLVLDIRGKAPGIPKLDLHLFSAWLLDYIGKKGWSLNASIPLPRKHLSFRSGTKKEIWVFRRKGGLGI